MLASAAHTITPRDKPLIIKDKSAIAKADAQSLRSAMKKQARNRFTSELDFCKWLWMTANAFVTTKDGAVPFYEWAGHESWKAYVEKEIGITGGKGRKYVRVHQTYAIDLSHVFDAEKHAIHIDKLMALMPLVDEDNLEGMIDNAREMTAAEFRALTVEGWDLTFKNVSYSFPRNQDRHRRRAFKMARKEWGEEMTDSEALVRILKDWATE